MASRFHQRDSRSSLFSTYDAQARSRPSSASPNPYQSSGPYRSTTNSNSNAYTYTPETPAAPSFSAYPGRSGPSSSSAAGGAYSDALTGSDERSRSAGGFRVASPNKRGQYSDAVLDELESQNDEQVSEMGRKVAMLKDITLRIGDEIRDSTALADKMNDTFGDTGARLKGTMNRMLRMAERTGVGWKVWVGFFAAVIVLFWYVWLT